MPKDTYPQEHQFYPDNFQPQFGSPYDLEPVIEPTLLEKLLADYMIKNDVRLRNFQNQVEEMTKALISCEPESSSFTDTSSPQEDVHFRDFDASISTDYEAGKGQQRMDFEHIESFEPPATSEYGEMEEKEEEEETMLAYFVEVSEIEMQEELVHDIIDTLDTPILHLDVQQHEKGHIIDFIHLEQPSTGEGSYFLKLALEEDPEVLMRASDGIHREIVQTKEHLTLFILVKAKAFDRAGV